jgi:hypothetical protein
MLWRRTQAELEDVKGMLRRQQGEEPGLAGAAAACSSAADRAHLEQSEVGSQPQTAGSADGLENLKDMSQGAAFTLFEQQLL